MLANYECDLHGHTNRSDGNDSPVEYIRHAVHRGVKILAITDHDIVPPEMIELGGGKRQEITAYAKGIGVELLRGIEISCETYIDDVHLVCLGCDWNATHQNITIQPIKEGQEIFIVIGEKLNKEKITTNLMD